MHIPSTRVHKEMRSEEVCIWYVPADAGKSLALLVKAPSSSIKAILAGSKLGLIFGLRSNYICLGIRIYDVPGRPLLISKVQRHNEEHNALQRFFQLGEVPIYLFNEMDVCVAWTDIRLTSSDQEVALRLTQNYKPYTGKYTTELEGALDWFELASDRKNLGSIDASDVFELSPNLSDWSVTRVTYAGFRTSETVVLDRKPEGEIFERSVWASLESVFPLTLFKSPLVQIGLKSRELTDILAFYSLGTFLFEAKDLSILEAGIERTQERRISGVQKQVKKAIGQLIGTSKGVKRDEKITDTNGSEINFNREIPFHCIVLITELMHEGDWDEIADQLISAMEETGDFFHVFDLRELITLLKCSNGNPALFDYNLIKRCEHFLSISSVHIRSRPAPKDASGSR